MGCDGGTIPKRDELVRQKKKPERKDKNAANMAKWRHCALRHDSLKRPVVADALGLIYNKDAMLEYLLDRSTFEHGPLYVKKMKDVKELQLTENPSFKLNHNDLGTEYLDVYSSPYICPLTGLEMNGKYKFCVIWSCGCVLSDRALRSVNNTSSTSQEKVPCPKCSAEYSSADDVVILYPEDEDVELMEDRRVRLTAMQKKNGSVKRKSPEAQEEEPTSKKTKTPVSETASASSAAASSASATTTKVSKVVSTTKTQSNGKGSSIQNDPTTTDLYKSLFTTSAAAKKKEKNKAHWVTYNPLYF